MLEQWKPRALTLIAVVVSMPPVAACAPAFHQSIAGKMASSKAEASRTSSSVGFFAAWDLQRQNADRGFGSAGAHRRLKARRRRRAPGVAST